MEYALPGLVVPQGLLSAAAFIRSNESTHVMVHTTAAATTTLATQLEQALTAAPLLHMAIMPIIIFYSSETHISSTLNTLDT